MSDKEIISKQAIIIAEQAIIIAELRAQIIELKALVSKLSVNKSSKNSHKPPSSDLMYKNQSLRPKSDKLVGGQEGHEGHTLKMSESPTRIEKLHPSFCNRCGSSLTSNDFVLNQRRQLIDIPPIEPIITEYQSYGTVCACGHCQVADFPQGIDNYVQYGPNVQSLAVYQSYYQFIPFGRLQDFFAKVCNLPISTATLENIIRRTSQKAMLAYDEIHKVIPLSLYVGSDETGYKLNGKKGWFWVWQTALLTYIVASTSRSKKVIEDTFPEGLPNSILSSDRLAAQLSTICQGNQICLAHLLRDTNYLIKAEETTWITQFKKILKQAIHLKQQQPEYDKNNPICLEIETKLNDLLSEEHLQLLLIDPQKNKQTITFFRAMRKVRNALFPFLYHKDLPFDNNGSERAIRMIKVKTKISGQFKSLQHEFAVIRSVIDTTIKNGQSVMCAIQAIVNLVNIPKAG